MHYVNFRCCENCKHNTRKFIDGKYLCMIKEYNGLWRICSYSNYCMQYEPVQVTEKKSE